MTTTIKVEARKDSGKGTARALRNAGKVPGVIYGAQKDPQAIALNAHDLMMTVRHGGFYTNLIELDIDGKTEKVLPRDLQRDPVKGHIMHVDFLRFDAKRKVKVMVHVRLTDEELSPGVKRGGVLQLVRPEVEVLCSADNIPQELVASAATMDVGESLHISAFTLPEGVELTIDRDFTVASILTTRTATMSEDEMGVTAESAAEAEAEAETEEDKAE